MSRLKIFEILFERKPGWFLTSGQVFFFNRWARFLYHESCGFKHPWRLFVAVQEPALTAFPTYQSATWLSSTLFHPSIRFASFIVLRWFDWLMDRLVVGRIASPNTWSLARSRRGAGVGSRCASRDDNNAKNNNTGGRGRYICYILYLLFLCSCLAFVIFSDTRLPSSRRVSW